MDNEERLKNVFSEALEIDEDRVCDSLEYNTIPEWDSVAHMALVTAIDEEFNVMLETEDVIDMNTFKKAKEILVKYGEEFEQC